MCASICVCWMQTSWFRIPNPGKIRGCREFSFRAARRHRASLSPARHCDYSLNWGQMKWHVLLCNENRAVLVLACAVVWALERGGSCSALGQPWCSAELCPPSSGPSMCDVIREQFAPWQSDPRKTPALLKQNKLLHLAPKTRSWRV